MPEKSREGRGDEQDDDQHILELLEEQRPGGDTLNSLKFIRAMLRQAASGFARG